LPEILIGLGNVEAIILTTNHHTRGAGYLSKRFECPVYVMPFRHLSRLATAHIRDSVKYREGEVLPGNLVAKRVQVFLKIGKRPYIDEMALVSVEDHAAFIGDALIGHFGTPELAVSKKIMTACYAALEAALPEHVTLLLPGNGFPIAGTYKNQINARHLLEPS
jgi:hypothetical protein